MNVQDFSRRYAVRYLREADIPAVLRLCAGNPLYFAHFPPEATAQSIRADMKALPPRTRPEDKYYVGYFDGQTLIAVLDLIDGYPQRSAAWVGLFMTDAAVQNSGVGSAIVGELCACLSEKGVEKLMLGWVRGNLQAEHFWKKNRFVETGDLRDPDGITVVLAERLLRGGGKAMTQPSGSGEGSASARIEALKAAYRLRQHPEGGWFSEVYTAPFAKDDRALMGSIYFLLAGGDISHFHQIDCDKLWYHHEGCALRVTVLHRGAVRTLLLGSDLAAGQRAMAVIPAGAIFAAENLDPEGYSFLSCATTPAFSYEGFRLVPRAEIAGLPGVTPEIERLAYETGEEQTLFAAREERA